MGSKIIDSWNNATVENRRLIFLSGTAVIIVVLLLSGGLP